MDKLILRKIFINGFGAFEGRLIDGLSELTVIYGENEAGKTTTMEFIRSQFFGFRDGKQKKNRYLAARGGRYGGYMELDCEDGKLLLERYKDEEKGAGTVFLNANRIPKKPEDLVGSISRELYESVFAFGLDELSELVKKRDASAYIYSAGMGISGISVSEIKENWAKEKEKIYKIKGSKPELNTILKQLTELKSKIGKLKRLPEEYVAISNNLDETCRQIESLENNKDEILLSLRRQERLLKTWKHFRQINLINDELLPFISKGATELSFPDIGRFDNLIDQKALSLKNISQMESDLVDKKKNRSGLIVEYDLIEQKEEIENLARFDVSEKNGEILRIEEDIRVVEKQEESLKKQLGFDWSKLDGFIVTPFVKNELRRFMQEKSDNQATVIKLSDEKKSANIDFFDFKSESDRLSDKQKNITARKTGELRALKSSLEIIKPLVFKFEKLQIELDSIKKNIEIEQVNITSPFPLYLAVFILISFSFYFLKNNLSIACVAAVIIAAVGYAIKMAVFDRQIKAVDMLREKEDELADEAVNCGDEISSQNLLKGNEISIAIVERLIVDIENETDAAQKKDRISEKTGEIGRLIKKTEGKLDYLLQEEKAVNNKQEALEQSWKEWLAENLVQVEVEPDMLFDILSVLEQLRENRETASGLTKQLEQKKNKMNHYYDNAKNIAKKYYESEELGDKKLIDTAIRDLKKRVELSFDCRHKKEILTVGIADIESRLKVENKNLAATLSTLKNVYEEASKSNGNCIESEQAFRIGHEQAKKVKGLLENKKSLTTIMKSTFGDDLIRAVQEFETLENEEQLGLKIDRLTIQLDDFKKDLDNAKEQKGRLSKEMEVMESTVELADATTAEAQLSAGLEEKSWEWSRYALAEFCLRKAERLYEKEKQHPVYKTASPYFESMTCGRYKGIVSHYDEEKELLVEDDSGRRLKVSELSRGTKGQLYLAMRFAYAMEFSKKLGAFPLIMDDILGDFDDGRTISTINFLSEISKTNQVLYFTCHKHIFDLFPDSATKKILGE